MSDDYLKKKKIAAPDIPIFEVAEAKLKQFRKDFEKLSSKKQDGELTVFKLKLLNEVLEPLNTIIGDDYRPSKDFTLFDIAGSFPTYSDVYLILAQYETALERFRSDHHVTFAFSKDGSPYDTKRITRWFTEEFEEEIEQQEEMKAAYQEKLESEDDEEDEAYDDEDEEDDGDADEEDSEELEDDNDE
jgi:hypothetical protein